ncbi:pro-resilin-like [Cherax quadricarinatus]|uniref:pro-resilin-like n=1 Tax=Cherax quadricarinatus TaxID=27406 RepID=UPI0023782392|nr:pro-resilin-like [Cherax quadricarinatus]
MLVWLYKASAASDVIHSLSATDTTLRLKIMKVAVLVVVLVAGVTLALPTDPYGQPVYPSEPIPYNFGYGVKDEYAGTDFGHNEDSDGHTSKGSYNVALPDGRIQTVNYVADHQNGYQAQVSYKGQAQYPHEYGPPVTFKPQYQGSYQPQPSYL